MKCFTTHNDCNDISLRLSRYGMDQLLQALECSAHSGDRMLALELRRELRHSKIELIDSTPSRRTQVARAVGQKLGIL